MDPLFSDNASYKAVEWNTDTKRWNTLIKGVTFGCAHTFAKNAWEFGNARTQVWRVDEYTHTYYVIKTFEV